MRNIFLIAKREYLERVRSKAFIIMTLLIPGLMFAVTALPTIIATHSGGKAKHLVIVASDERTAESIRQQLEEWSRKTRNQTGDRRRSAPQLGALTIDVDTNTSEAERAALTQKVTQKQLDGVVFATDDALKAKKVEFLTRDVSSIITNSELERGLNDALRRRLLRNKGMSDAEIESALKPVSLEAESPSGISNSEGLFFTVITLVMILYMTVFLYGVNVMRAVTEEKTSRIMEVMLASARPSEMMAGKVIGVAAVGLTQIGIWALLALAPAGVGLIAAMSSIKGVLTARLITYFALFFVLGFALYSTICAAVGAMVNSEQESQQLQFVVAMPLIAAVILMFNTLESPGSPVAVAGSLFPLTAPLMMFLRVALQAAPWWQILLSIVLMLVTIWVLVWVCARIYRIGILMYGKKPTLPEIMKWIRYA